MATRTRTEMLPERLRRIREASGKGLRETAALVGISPAYLSRVETTKEVIPPSAEVLTALAGLLGDDADELLRLAGRVPTDLQEWFDRTPDIYARLRKLRDG